MGAAAGRPEGALRPFLSGSFEVANAVVLFSFHLVSLRCGMHMHFGFWGFFLVLFLVMSHRGVVSVPGYVTVSFIHFHLHSHLSAHFFYLPALSPYVVSLNIGIFKVVFLVFFLLDGPHVVPRLLPQGRTR